MRMQMIDGNSHKLPELVTDHNSWHKCIKCGMSITKEPMWEIEKEIRKVGVGGESGQESIWDSMEIVACTVCAPTQEAAFGILGFSCSLYESCICGKCTTCLR